MSSVIDLNCDAGESYGAFRIGSDEQLFRHVSSANIACGWHGGDPVTMRRTVEQARQLGVRIGAHPSFPDLLGFGRRAMTLSVDEAKAYLTYQAGALEAFVRTAGLEMQHVKLHGAWYNQAACDPELAEAVVEAVVALNPRLILLGLPGSHLLRAATKHGLRIAREFFADRAYRSDGSLAPRGTANSLLRNPEEAAERALRAVAEGVVSSVDGQTVQIEVDSICIHGDQPDAVDFARTIRQRLEHAGVAVRALADFIR